MFEIRFTPCPGEGPESDRIIASGKRWLCQDWTCPAAFCCARHYGRSKEYAAMAEKHPPLVIPHRGTRLGEKLPICEHYRRDDFRADWDAPLNASLRDVAADQIAFLTRAIAVESRGKHVTLVR